MDNVGIFQYFEDGGKACFPQKRGSPGMLIEQGDAAKLTQNVIFASRLYALKNSIPFSFGVAEKESKRGKRVYSMCPGDGKHDVYLHVLGRAPLRLPVCQVGPLRLQKTATQRRRQIKYRFPCSCVLFHFLNKRKKKEGGLISRSMSPSTNVRVLLAGLRTLSFSTRPDK